MLLREIKANNLLSFGPEGLVLPLHPLNVLIGPNGSGKSNVIEAISLLHSAPADLARPVRVGGGVREWIWKGAPDATAWVEAVVDNPDGRLPLRHQIGFSETAQRFELIDERIENAEPFSDYEEPYFYYRFQRGRPVLNVNAAKRQLAREDVEPDRSILSQRKDPDQYPEITYLGRVYERIRLYREWSFGRYAAARQPQKADQPNDLLATDYSNLGLVLNRLWGEPQLKRSVLHHLRQLYAGIEDCHASVEGGTVQIFLHESGFAIPATRLSDGTLRFLCLLAVLCDPKPPPLVCIEEPELGLHPDIIPTIVRLLREASQRMQLVVTTHSDILVDELSEEPESVVVCDKTNGRTVMRRLDSGSLESWLKKCRLGQLWTQGEIGGVRW